MTDKEIIQALECCIKSTSGNDCEDLNCPACDEIGCRFMNQSTEYYPESLIQEMGKAALDLINRQKAEIERLKNAYKQCAWERDVFSEDINAIKSEAYREFAERLKEKADRGFWQERSYVDTDDIDNLLEELTEKNDKE